MGTKSGEASTGRKKRRQYADYVMGLQGCKELKRENPTIRGILKGEEEGAEWMRMVLEKKEKKRRTRLKEEVETKAQS